MGPLFSIIVPTFNRPQLLQRAIRSIFKQTFESWEIIVINDGSTEFYHLEELEHPQVRYYSKENTGLASTRNYGITRAIGEYVCFLDDDDEYMQNHLFELHKLIDLNPTAGLFRTLTYLSYDNNNLVEQEFKNYQDSTLKTLYNNLLTVNNVCLPRKVFEQYRFDPSIPIAEDYDLWTRLAMRYDFTVVKKYTTVYYINEETMSSGSVSKYSLYINVYSYILSHPKVISLMGASFIKNIIFKYYNFSFYILSRDKKIFQLLEHYLKSFRYNPSYFTKVEPYKLLIKAIL